MSKLKQNIQRALIERDISLARLAHLSGVQQSTLHRIVTGAIKEPRSSTVAPLARFLGVSVQTLQDGDVSTSFTPNNSSGGFNALAPLAAEPKLDVTTWDRDSHLRTFEAHIAHSSPAEHLHWRCVVDGNSYNLDYCSERLVVELVCFSRPTPSSHPMRGRVDFSGLFTSAASHLVDLFMINAAYSNLTPLLLILTPEIPDEQLAPVRKLIASARRLGVRVRFATSGLAAIQIVSKTEAELLDESTVTERH